MPLRSNSTSSPETEIRNRGFRSVIRRCLLYLDETDALVRGSSPYSPIALSHLNRKHLNREAVLLSFCHPVSEKCFATSESLQQRMERIVALVGCQRAWRFTFWIAWRSCNWSNRLPAAVLARLEQNLQDNQERTRGMIVESVAIQQEFQEAELSYATLKGFSLSPHSVPRPELRHQFDLDFLVAQRSAAGARKILERRGYRLYAMSGRSWEFKRDDAPGHIRDLYKNLPCRSVELHIEAEEPGYQSLLERVEIREFHGISMPVLSPVDLFIGQGLHAYKHVCSEFSRTSHLLEFRRHVLSRRDDDSFWKEVQSRAEGNVKASVGLGIVTLLITSLMGDFAPEALTSWTVSRLPRTARSLGKHCTAAALFSEMLLEASCICFCRGSLSPKGFDRSAPCGRHYCLRVCRRLLYVELPVRRCA